MVPREVEEDSMHVRALILSAVVSACVSAIMAFAVAWVTAPTLARAASGGQEPALVLRTQQLEITDSTGAVRATLGTSGDSIVMLALHDQAGRAEISLGLQDVRRPEGTVTVPVIVVASSHGAQANLIGGPDGSISWTMGVTGAQGRVRGIAGIGVDADGNPRIRLLDGNAQSIWEAP